MSHPDNAAPMPGWDKTQGVGEFVASLIACPSLGPQIAAHRLIPASAPEYGENRLPWSRAVASLLENNGINLFSHQTQATDHIRCGRSVVISTPTASGKSLVYNLPVLEKFLHDPEARSLYLFPLKALARDQLSALNGLHASWPRDCRLKAAIYDGDTSEDDRRDIRKAPPNALITNPEMLHLGILPHHAQWTTFLANLTFVIVDEAHTYRGIFGSHMANVFRRLNRIVARYGANPVYIFCTATLGNPEELASGLLGSHDKPVSIARSGAPQGPRHFMFLDPELSASTCAIDLLRRSLERGLRTIVYCQSRRMTELISLWAASGAGEMQDRISAYRAGFRPDERRAIEAAMASGELMAVVTTSALELGIDIGGLDVCILVGYPGTIMQTLQRGGRVGRSGRESAVLVVAGEDALDQYFIRNPGDFFNRQPEKAVINPDNEVILRRHLECAATELPLHAAEPLLQSPAAIRAISCLEKEGTLRRVTAGQEWVATSRYPQKNVDLRGSGETFSIEDGSGGVIGVIDGFRAWRETHKGAVYLHRGKSYIIEEMDPGARRIRASQKKVDWFTRARSRKSTEILEEYERATLPGCLLCRGRLRITEQITAYEKRSTSGRELLAVLPLDAPPMVFETEGLWYVIPDSIRASLENRFIHIMGSIHALEHALIGLLPLSVLADRNDFGGISTVLHPQLGHAAVFVYDGLPGGAGLTAAAFPNGLEMLKSTFRAISTCPCEDGCPSCIQSPKCGAGNRPLSKSGSLELLGLMLAPGKAGESLAARLAFQKPDNCGEKEKDNSPRIAAEGPVPMAAESPANTYVTLAMTNASDEARDEPVPDHYVVFDVETRLAAREVGGWQNAAKMGVSVAACYDSLANDYFVFEQSQLEGLFEKMAKADLVVGFNSLRFDYEVLAPFARTASSLASPDLRKLPSLDLLKRIRQKLRYPVSLDNLANATLNAAKSGDGLQALRWWKEGRIAEIAEYCRKDVELTLALYRFGLKEKYLFFSNKAGQKVRVAVDFSP